MIGSRAKITSPAILGNSCINGPSIDVSVVSWGSPPVILSVLDIILIIITDMIAPVEAIATNPKLSFSDDLLSFFKLETPIARAKIKGTVKAPVVAPEASKEIAKNSGDVKNARIKIIPYKTVNNLYKGKL